MRSILAALSLCLMACGTAHATVGVEYDRHAVSGAYSYGPVVASPRQDRVKRKMRDRRTRDTSHVASNRVVRPDAQIVSHPSGCPARAFCGCGASVEVFGRSIRELWLASNWFRFPPAAPAPGMVAVRRHHVFVIREVIGPGLVLAYDANSGGRQTRIHPRSLAGYSVRNPRGSSYASAL